MSVTATGGLVLPEYEWENEGEFEDESELEFESEDELEAMANPLARAYPDVVMAHLGHAAAATESEAEAEAFVGALVPLATSLAGRAVPTLMRTAPQLVRGLSTVTRSLRRNPATRPLVRALPTVLTRTTRSLARQIARGRPLTPTSAVRTLARQTDAVLSNPDTRRVAYRRSRALDRDYHRQLATATTRGLGRPPHRTVPRGEPFGRERAALPAPGPGTRGLPGMSVAWVPVPAVWDTASRIRR